MANSKYDMSFKSDFGCLFALVLLLKPFAVNAEFGGITQYEVVGENSQRLNPRLAPVLQKLQDGSDGWLKLSDDPRCERDIKALCPESKNNLAVLDCLQNKRKKNQELAASCQHLVWSYKRNLTTNGGFYSAAGQVCKHELDKIDECKEERPHTGFRIACLMEHKENVASFGCRMFLTKMGSIVFSDYKLVSVFLDQCIDDIDRQECGRLHAAEDDSPHTQGMTIECLENSVKKVSPQCKVQILRIAELQSDDFHLNRPLYYACREDREKFCDRVRAGQGAVLKCLIKNKFEPTMSTSCRAKLTGVQKLMDEDVRINRPLYSACKQAIRDNSCFKGVEPPKFHQARQSVIVLCLEGAMADDKQNRSISSECRAEMKDTRRAIMEDYKISPDIVAACADDISSLCEAGIERGGKTLHCLMQNSRKGNLEETCQREVEKLIEEVNPAQDVSLDRQLYRACAKMINKCKADKDTKSEDMMSCLMDNIESDEMPDECANRVLELQYFISSNFKLSPKLFRECRDEAKERCGIKQETYDSLHHGQTYACLYRSYKKDQLSRSCSIEMRRTLRQRSVWVDLNPRIQEPCMQYLAVFCGDFDNGNSIECLQKNFVELDPACATAVGNFTQDADKDVRMDRSIMRSCTSMIRRFCQDVQFPTNTDHGDVMECLIKNKNSNDMNAQCRAAIERHQIVSLTDFRFTFKFQEACKQDVMKLCKDRSKSKSEVVSCLSTTIRNDTLRQRDHRVSPQCRKQVTFELLQRSENVNMDPKLKDRCYLDIKEHCSGIEPGKGAILNCLLKVVEELFQDCQEVVLNRAEMAAVYVKSDYSLFIPCQRMIKTHCAESKPGEIFDCLKEHKGDGEFDLQCKKMLLERMRERAKDIRLNPKLDMACQADAKKFCDRANIMNGVHFEAAILTCLRLQFTRKTLSKSCETHISELVKESHIDYKQNPVLAKACQTEIKEHCMGSLNDQDMDDQGQVGECLKGLLSDNQIKNDTCQREVLQIIKESKVDVHTDIVLYRACALDIKHVCAGVPRGEGRQMTCLLGALGDKKVKLSRTCKTMMNERRDLWRSVAAVQVEDTLSNRSCFYNILMIFIGFLLICGLMSRRLRPPLIKSAFEY